MYVAHPHTIEWKVGMPTGKIEMTEHGSALFVWTGTHSLWQFEGKDAFDFCDFNRAKELSSDSGYVFKSHAGTYYFGCSVYGHCEYGQKIEILVTDDTEKMGSCHTHSHVHSSMKSTIL